MKKQVLGVVMSCLIVSSLSANDLQKDLDFAFGGEVEATGVVVLDDEQMDAIKGKGWGKFTKRVRKVVKSELTGSKLILNLITVAAIIYPPTGFVSVPGVTTQAKWVF